MRRIILALLFSLLAGAANATAYFAVCTTTCTWDNSSTAMWSLTSGGGTGVGPPTVTDTVTLDASTCVGGTTCTITPNANLAIVSLTMGACTASTTGCILDFSVHNNNITLSGNNGFSGQGTGTRTLKMGNGTWTLLGTSTGNAWRLDNVTNMTFNANSSTILISNSGVGGPAFLSSALTYNTIEIAGVIQLATSILTINTLIIDGGAYAQFAAFTAYTINNFVSNATKTSMAGIVSNSVGAQASLIVPANTTMSWVSLRDLTFSGSGSPAPTATNSFNMGELTNITVSPPGGGNACVLGGWLLYRDLPDHINDNFPAWLEKAA